jgi:excisionase family DNA binding protein
VARNRQPAKPEQLQLFFSSRYLNIEQVAEIIGVPKSFIYPRTARGHGDPIPHYRLGGHLRFKLDDVEEWIERHRNESERESPATLVAAIRERSSRRSTKPLKQRQIRRRTR